MWNDQISRRRFVRDGTLAAAGMAVGLNAAEAAKRTRSYSESMEYRPLGATGLMLSAISLGGHWKKVPYQYGTEAFARNRRDVVSACIDCGINYIDACAEGEVLAYAEALRGRREKMYLGFSYYEHEMRFAEWQTAEKLLGALDDLMVRAKLDYVDLWRPTCYWQPHTDHTAAHEEAMVEALEKAKKAGKVRFGGMSTHKHDWAMRMVQTYPQTIQAIVLPYTAGSKKAHMRVEKSKGGWHAVAEQEGDSMHSLIDVVKKSRAGWVGIKPFAGGSLFKVHGASDSRVKDEDDQRARLTLRYVLCNDALTCAIPGLATTEQVYNAAKAVNERRELDVAERRQLDEAVEEMWAKLPSNYKWLKNEWEYV